LNGGDDDEADDGDVQRRPKVPKGQDWRVAAMKESAEHREQIATSTNETLKTAFSDVADSLRALGPQSANMLPSAASLIAFPKKNTDTRAWVHLLFNDEVADKVLKALASAEIGLDLDQPDDVLLLDSDMLDSCASIGKLQRKKLLEAVAALVANAK
jgi:hypothetical protein